MNDEKAAAALIEPTRVSIFNQIYSLRSHSDPEHVRRIARLVDERMRQVASHAPTHDVIKIAILAALNIADELERLREQVERAGADGETASDASAASASREPEAVEQDSQDGRQKPSWYEDLFEARPGKSDERLSSLISSKLQMQRQPNPEPFTIEAEDEGK